MPDPATPKLPLIPVVQWISRLRSVMRSTRLAEEESARKNPWLATSLELEKMEGQKIATWARTLALLVIAPLLVYINPRIEVVYYLVLSGGFVLLGLAQQRAARVGQSRLELALIFLDLILLTLVLTLPNPFAKGEWPTAIQYRFEGFSYFYVFLAGATLAYSWRTVQTIGLWTGIIWLAGVGMVAIFGTQIPDLTTRVQQALTGYERIFEIIDPNSINFPGRIQEVVIFIIVAAILGMKSRRSARLLAQQAGIAAERANLSRYFPPTMVDELARRSTPMGGTRTQDVAVLFADIVGFTRLAEESQPEAVISLLRQYHALLEEAVFAHGGTLDKYLGDGVMASFGTPSTGPNDARNALNAAFAMLSAMERLNQQRSADGLESVRISVGVHFGPVTLGDIGTARRMEFAMLGDTVNVAARIEAATRQFPCALAVSQAAMSALGEESAQLDYQQRMQPHKSVSLRGREEPVDLWIA